MLIFIKNEPLYHELLASKYIRTKTGPVFDVISLTHDEI